MVATVRDHRATVAARQIVEARGRDVLPSWSGVARENARLQYAEANPAPATPLEEHFAEFDGLWRGLERKWLRELSDGERRRFDALTMDTERDAFRIIRNWSRADKRADDFKIQVEGLAARIGLSIRGAGKLRRRFCSLGILRKTADYVPHRLCARYKWRAGAKQLQPSKRR
jgi:hypothetical protein